MISRIKILLSMVVLMINMAFASDTTLKNPEQMAQEQKERIKALEKELCRLDPAGKVPLHSVYEITAKTETCREPFEVTLRLEEYSLNGEKVILQSVIPEVWRKGYGWKEIHLPLTPIVIEYMKEHILQKTIDFIKGKLAKGLDPSRPWFFTEYEHGRR